MRRSSTTWAPTRSIRSSWSWRSKKNSASRFPTKTPKRSRASRKLSSTSTRTPRAKSKHSVDETSRDHRYRAGVSAGHWHQRELACTDGGAERRRPYHALRSVRVRRADRGRGKELRPAPVRTEEGCQEDGHLYSVRDCGVAVRHGRCEAV